MTLTRLKKGNENYQRNQINAILGEAEGELAKKAFYKAGTVASTAPTWAELTAAFGAPATLGVGFSGIIDGGTTKCFSVMTDGADWYVSAAMTLKAAPTTTTTTTTTTTKTVTD